MAAPAPQEMAAGHINVGESAMLIPNAVPPAYNEKQLQCEGRSPVQVQQQGGQLPQAQYPQVQLGAGVLPSQTWPTQGYPPVSRSI